MFSGPFHGLEAWTLIEATMKKLDAFEMWLYRKILKIYWKDHVTYNEVPERIAKEKDVVCAVKFRKLQYLEHIISNYSSRFHLIGKISVGRRRNSSLKNIRTWFGLNAAELFPAAANKVK